MENSRSSADIRTRFRCVIKNIYRKLLLLLVSMFLCGAAYDAYCTLKYVPQYGASMTATLSNGKTTFQNLSSVSGYVPTLKYLLNSRNARSYVQDQLGMDTATYHADVAVQQANIITISITAATKREAYFSLRELLDWYSENNTQFQFPYSIYSIKQSAFSGTPVNSFSHKRKFGIGAAAGGIAVLLILILYYYFRETVKTSQEAHEVLNARLYGVIPYEKKKNQKGKNGILVTSLKTSISYREAMKRLAAKLEASAGKHGYQSIMITSSLENEGKSSISANLALSLAERGHKTILVDLDVRKPSVARLFGIRDDKCLNQVLKGEEVHSQILREEHTHLDVLTCRQQLEDSLEFVSQPGLAELIDILKEEYEFIILDVSPSYLLEEPTVITKLADACLMVVRQDDCRRDIINETIDHLTTAKDNIIGTIFNEFISRPAGESAGAAVSRYGQERRN